MAQVSWSAAFLRTCSATLEGSAIVEVSSVVQGTETQSIISTKTIQPTEKDVRDCYAPAVKNIIHSTVHVVIVFSIPYLIWAELAMT